ncbi:two-component sensor histidine kinase [Spirosoma sp. HMF4905]|uniref:histidine kinase n=1 Tax=Spirosoma arboris TaxID=2682092 RepID=A0A7K1S5X6_9BACT|nr:ATP-binding protein [Spirosoma arboris]MVM29130.1 two-component sensor histidine kinase [Spirosoma arboris]
MNIPVTSSDRLATNSLLLNAMPGKHLILLPDELTFPIVAVSDDYLTAFGLQREGLVGYGVFELFFKDEINAAIAPRLQQSLIQVIRTKQTHIMADQLHQWPNAQTGALVERTWRPVNKPVIDSDGQLAYIIHTVEDITPEVQLMEVAQANWYLQTIINSFKEPMQVLQPVVENGEIIDFCFKLTNQAYAAYANTTPEQLQGKRVGEVFPGYFETVSFTNPVETYKTGQPLTFDIHYDKDGLDLYNVMSTVKLDDEVVIHFTDFTRVRQLQSQLESKIDELNRSNANLQQFAYIASHDLQEPLRKIQSFSSLLASQLDDQLTPTSHDYLQRISHAGARMSTLIKDLLAYSRISAQQQDFGPVSLATVIADVLTTLDWTISQEKARVEVDALPIVTGDASQLGQLFQNLLSNALKFREPNQPPRVEVRSALLTRSELPLAVRPTSSATQFHCISVRDEGIGFDPRYVDRIFQVFQRLHGKQTYAGTGVGLAICQQVANNHGGGITATSAPGEGATFWVYLPV